MFDKYIEEQNKPKTYGSYGSGTYNRNYNSYTPPTQLNDCTIFFYEWSNLRMGAKHFHKKDEFFKFLNDSNIVFNDMQKKNIEEAKYKNIFATCVPNQARLITSDTWYNLNTLVESFKTSEN